MSKEVEILKTGISCHDTLLPKIKQIKGGPCISGVSILQKLTHLYSEIFFVFEGFSVQVTRQVTLVNSGEMQSSSSGSIKHICSIFFEAVEQKCLIPLSMTIIFS